MLSPGKRGKEGEGERGGKEGEGGIEGGEEGGEGAARVAEAVRIRDLLRRTPEEISNVLGALNGEFIPAAPGGDLLRDGPSVLPTGRNIHALDPYRMPSLAANARGKAAAAEIVRMHRKKNGGRYPETVAVNLWGLDR